MPEWLKKKLRQGGADNPHAVMNAAGIGKNDTRASVSNKMSRFQKGVHRRKRRQKKGAVVTAGQAAERLAYLLLVGLLLVAPAAAQDDGKRTTNAVIGYDVASATQTYALHVGARGDVWADPFRVNIPIDTTGSSTTVDAVTAATLPFANLGVGDLLIVRRDNSVTDQVWITAKASGDQVTVDTAVDWSDGYVFEWRDLVTGTGADDGWMSVSTFSTVQMTIQYEAGDLTGLDVAWFCKHAGPFAGPVRVYPGIDSDCGDGALGTKVCVFATLGDRLTVSLTNNAYAQCRVGLAWSGADGGTREDVRVIVTVEP